MNHVFEQGPALRAILSSGESQGVPLRGGFYNAITGIPLNGVSRVSSSLPARSADAEWGQFRESFAETVLSLGKDKCAPPLLCWMPKGLHCIRPQGHQGELPIIWRVDAKMAAIANRHLQALRAKAVAGDGQTPFIDFDHTHGIAGEVTELFWDDCGIRASVSWTPEGEAAILAGQGVSFSPHWITSGLEFLGLRACVGGLLSVDVTPAFQRMPAVKPMQKRQAVRICADRFLRNLDTRSTELREQGVEHAAVMAFDQLKEEQPELHACYALRAAINDEHWKDIQIRHA